MHEFFYTFTQVPVGLLLGPQNGMKNIEKLILELIFRR